MAIKVDGVTTPQDTSYSEGDITILEGLEAVRKRPGMYIGSTGPTGLHHLVWEVVDNSVDEAMAGRATRIDVTLLADGGCRVRDDGAGIPVGPHPKNPKMSTAEIVLTMLHAGGKFGGKGYQVSGGLHGVGISVVNALSTRLLLEIDRDGQRWEAEFEKGGKITRKIAADRALPDEPGDRRAADRHHGHLLAGRLHPRRDRVPGPHHHRAHADHGLFEQGSGDPLHRRARPTPELKTTFRYAGGIVDFVKHLNAAKESLFRKVAGFEEAEEGQEVEIALQWNTGFHESIHSFANGISTIEGGMHEEGFRTALTNTVNRYARARNLLKEKEENLQGEDIREGLTAIISVRLRDPQFEGQTKAKLGNQSMRSLVVKATNKRAGRMAGGEPTRGQPDRAEVDAGGPGPHGRAGRTRPHPPQVGPRRRRVYPESWPTAPRATRASPSCSSSRATRPADRPRTPATRAPRPSCPSAGRSSTSSGPASTRC